MRRSSKSHLLSVEWNFFCSIDFSSTKSLAKKLANYSEIVSLSKSFLKMLCKAVIEMRFLPISRLC